ncbi:NAD(P)-binding protein [Aspergillus aculeatinus CBS 121060]|uniref:NAD(P)-binding protein n=1 Tax=Aspergillus aculeatinus CBS 121060 TaxID=1448322 RepID=A0ACD1H655_9EURO|nr:NAD(P)-binding protein [Aspergillus aculeatinus CBS 121060]RAH68887.1 NAD(P)-binding protein [Aspergillus aculeatinus CBS 121060]
MPGCALVTGCSAGGIGSALVEELHAQGLRVYATARSPAKMGHLAKLPNVTLVALNVVDPISLAAAVNTVRQDLASHGDTLNILINNAGQSLVYPALDTSIDKAKCLFDVNFCGVLAVTQAFMPLLLVSDNGSTIVNVCSISGFLYAPWMSVYNASKAALMSWKETLRLELQPFNIRVISLVTGAVATNVMSHANLTLPEGSLYHKALPEIQTRGAGKDVLNKSAPDDFARQVVQDILGGASGPVWRGAMASMVKVVFKYIPTGILDRAMKRGTGLEKLP